MSWGVAFGFFLVCISVAGIFVCTLIVQLLLVGMQKVFNYCYKRWFQPK